MEKNIVMIEKEDLLVGTCDLAVGFKVEHRAILRIIGKYKEEFEELGKLTGFVTTALQQIEVKNPEKRGRRFNEYKLNEPQTVYLTTLLTNNLEVRKFKLQLTKEFFKQRKLLNKLVVQRQNEEWRQKRISGKTDRRIETDSIKEFIEYATEQGSKNAKLYYMNISKMENKLLLPLELLKNNFENVRDICTSLDLNMLQMADLVVSRSLHDGMKKEMYYKDIYQHARDQVEAFACVMGRQPFGITKVA